MKFMELKWGRSTKLFSFSLLCFGLFCHTLSSAKENTKTPQTQVQSGKSGRQNPSKAVFLAPQNQKWVTPPAHFPAGIQLMVLDGDPSKPKPFIMRLKLPANHEIRPHWHPADERVAVISGHIMMGLGDTLDKQKEAYSLPAGSYFRIPAKTHHYGWTTEETVLQLMGHGPWRVNFLSSEGKAGK